VTLFGSSLRCAGSSPAKVLPFIQIHPFCIHDPPQPYLFRLHSRLGLSIYPFTLGEPVVRPSFIMSDPERDQSLEDYKKSLLELREWETKLKTLRLGIKDLQREFDISEENIKALQSVGQIIGEVLKQLDEERCEYHPHSYSSWACFGRLTNL
jgi:hypothetical protein